MADEDADETEQAANTYRSSMKGSKWGADARAATIRSALNRASQAMMAGAWQSTVADQFGQDLSTHRSSLFTLGGAEWDELDDRISREPSEVDKTDWRATFNRNSRRQIQ